MSVPFSRWLLNEFQALTEVQTATVDPAILSIAGLTTSANQMIYTVASNTYATTTLSAFARTILDDASASDVRATIGTVIGSDVQAYDATLSTLSGNTVTAFALTLLDDSTALSARTTLGAQEQGDVLDDLNILGASTADGEFLVATGAGALAWEAGGTARTSLGLGTSDGPEFATVKTTATTVASLPAAATAGAGARAFVTDATATTFLSTAAGGGANAVPVVSDGTNWLIG